MSQQNIMDTGNSDGVDTDLTGSGKWTPTPENINSLPKPVKLYIHGLESLCDPAHIIAENTLLRDQTVMLDKMIAKLKQRIIFLTAYNNMSFGKYGIVDNKGFFEISTPIEGLSK